MSPVLDAEDVLFRHGEGRAARTTLHATSLVQEVGSSVAVTGRSGAGKSTFAEIILGLRRPSGGRVLVQGTPWCTPRQAVPRDRRGAVQGVPQDAAAAFLPHQSVGTQISRAVRRLDPAGDVRQRIAEAALTARLDPMLLDRRPSELSGGQAQRAAIARALAIRPALLVADEPTSALDRDTARELADELLALTRSTGIALLLITHDERLADRCDRRLVIVPPAEPADRTARSFRP